jgi:hypothetical protein
VANSLLTINMITREAIRLWKNSNEFIRHIDSQYDDSFAKTGAKIGTALRIRLPNDFTVRTGPAASVQDTSEQSTTLTLATQQGVDVSYSSVDRTMSLDDFSKRVLAPMVNNLAGAVASNVMAGSEGGVSNFTANLDSGGNVLSPTAATWLQAGAILDQISAPRMNRKIIMDPVTQARTVSSLAGLFNPSAKISSQYASGQMQQALGFDWFMDQTVIKHTTAAYSGTKQVSGSNQTGLSIVTGAITGGLKIGDIITFDGVNSVNRITKASNGQLAQFVVTATVASGGTAIPIYPALIPAAASGAQVQYQTVDVSPASGANVNVVTLASSVFRKNIAFVPEAVTLATADLELPKGVHEAAREVFDDVSMRMISAYNIMTDQFITRLDVLYGYLWVRPEWAVEVADAI